MKPLAILDALFDAPRDTVPDADRSPSHFELQLDRRALFSLPDAAGVQIRCHSGSLWLTLDGDPRDIVLEAGDSFTSPEHRRALLYAFDASRIELAAPPARPPRRIPAPVRTLAFEQVIA